jgi:biopolymer transport protein ExbD
MRFARQSVIFRGPLDPAAVVCVFFLLVIFVMARSLTYTPGVLVRFRGPGLPDRETLVVTRENTVIFEGKTNTAAELDQLRANLKNSTNSPPFRLLAESGADSKLVERVQSLFPIQLPTNDLANLTGTDNPTVIVAVNFRGQCFYENRPIQERELKNELRTRLEEVSRQNKKLTLVLEADRSTENEVVMRLLRLAREVGIPEFLLAERPSDFAAPTRNFPP